MNTLEPITLRDNVITAWQAQRRVEEVYHQNANHDRGVLCNYLYGYLERTGLHFPGIDLRYEGGKYNSDFCEWLAKLDKWFFTVAALYNINLPEEE